MSLCPHCQGENREDAERCIWCGLPLHPAREDDAASGAPASDTYSDSETSDAWDEEDPLAGLTGLLPPVTLPPITEGNQHIETEITEQERQDAALLHRIASAPPPLGPPREPPVPLAPPLPERPWRLALALLVILAALVPLITGGRLDTALSPQPGVAAFASALDALQPGDRVIVAYDHAPSAAAELAPAGQAAVADLAARSVALVALSSRPEGVDIARQALESLAVDGLPLRYGTDYALLGYLAGEATGLRLAATDLAAAFAQTDAAGTPLEQLPILNGLNKAVDADAMLVLTDDANVARRWIEQVGSRTDAPLLMLTTAAIEPLLIPYADSGQLAALLSGAYGNLPHGSMPSGGASTRPSLYSADGFLALWIVLVLAFVLGLRATGRHRSERQR